MASQIPLPTSEITDDDVEALDVDALTLLIGNSKAIWPKFLAYCASDTSILDHPHPLNAYIERSINAALEIFLPLMSSSSSQNQLYKIYWSHSTANLRGGEGFVAMQRMAECSGLAFLDHTSHLSFHPKFGPWFSLRCAIVFSGDVGSSASPLGGSLDTFTKVLTKPTPLRCPLDDATMDAVKSAAVIAFSASQNDANKEEDGVVAVEKKDLPGMKDVRAGWEKWLAVRDAAAPGHPYRYSRDQILYHYTGNRDLLRELVLRLKESGEKNDAE